MVKVGNLCFKDIDGYCGYTDIATAEEFERMQYTGAHSFDIYALNEKFEWSPYDFEEYQRGVGSLFIWSDKHGH